jgi:hypothetical protein
MIVVRLIPVPAAGADSGFVDISELPEVRTLNFQGVNTGDKLEVDFAMGVVGPVGLAVAETTVFAGTASKQVTNAAPLIRIRRTAGTGACSFGVAAFVPDTVAGPPGPPGLGQLEWRGDLTTTDAAPTPIPSSPQSTTIGAFGPSGFIPTLDGTYSVLSFGSLFITAGPDAGTGSQFLSCASFTVAAGVVTLANFTALVGAAIVISTDGSAIQAVATGIALDTIDWTHNSTIQFVG